MINLEELYWGVKFMLLWYQQLVESGLRLRNPPSSFSLSEEMTILILFHSNHYRDFKTFYLGHVKHHILDDFPRLISYTRMLILKKRALIPCMHFFYRVKRKRQT